MVSVRRSLLPTLLPLLLGCGPGSEKQEFRVQPAAAALDARALVRPYLRGAALTAPDAGPTGAPARPAPAVVVAHRHADGSVTVGCVDTEDGVDALVRAEDRR